LFQAEINHRYFRKKIKIILIKGPTRLKKQLVVSNGGFDPVSVATHLSINPRIARLSTAITPGNNSSQFPIAHHRTARITLSIFGKGKEEMCDFL